ncbi:MFS transporter [Pseudoxanthomonas winnipegensis]|uniref:MFS transporter n=1 Tax=Pseudoxanthomonas winnipegensis TaxID=2480810 RepID=A0A4Q8LMQ7_9GAMM|nr:MFS transporter [Pseudoxanthomonas winnipegensis]RZZ84012.1 MFS transporter [Pseudoxanthomonas winnipegensis]TAA32153.1 MFS transporter [Pseudoxanthomonas winnipegensis]
MSSRPTTFPLMRVLLLNAGFFGVQYSFGLQQSNMSPIYSYLGADHASLPYLWLAGPVTGLVLQPLVGAISDRTSTRWGRRLPFIVLGALVCSLCLLTMPFSTALWMAVCLLWVLDAANNVAMEPYRALVSDVLTPEQRPLGFLTQSAFTGLGQTLAYLTPSLLVWFGMDQDAANSHHIPYVTIAAFVIGAAFSAGSILLTARSVREPQPTPAERARLRQGGQGLGAALREIVCALREMPPTMRQLAPVMLFQWYAMFCYWQYIVLSLSTTLFGTTDPASHAFRQAGLINGQIGSFYNFVAFVAAFAMVPFTRRFGPKPTHAACLTAAGIGMLLLPVIQDRWLLLLPMIGIGLAWASMMGNPYLMLAERIPPERTGVYMGLFNLFIVLPMLIQILTLPLYFDRLLGGDARNVIRLAGALLLAAAVSMLFVGVQRARAPRAGAARSSAGAGYPGVEERR